ncbi:MAG: helix-turn-helix domain-containing protein [Phycisphaerae bacterium]|nr:helix-turn-helix domain-containing protein [Phycisphaerae bacterium]
MSPEKSKNSYRFIPPTVLPDGNGGFTPCPELLTEEEAIRFLRLDLISVEDSSGTLRYYRKKGLLRATQVGKCIRYRRIELEKLLEKLTEVNPR